MDVVTKPRVAAGIEGRRKELGSDLGIPSPSCPRSCHRATAGDIGGWHWSCCASCSGRGCSGGSGGRAGRG